MELILNDYYKNNAHKLHQMVDGILAGFGGLSDKDLHDFYSLANEVFVHVMRKYDKQQSFDRFLFSCLSNRIKSEITKRNRYKRRSDKLVLSFDDPLNDYEDLTIGDVLVSEVDFEEAAGLENDKVERFLARLSKVDRQIVCLKMYGIPVIEIKKRLGLTERAYESHWKEIKSFSNISILYEDTNQRINLLKEEKTMRQIPTQTMEKSKPDRLSISSIIKKMDKHTIRFDHPLQRESEQWASPSMRGNLISDILQGNPIPSLVFAEQIVNGAAIIWDLDGKQRCTNAYAFRKNGYKISKNIRRYMIEYQSPVVDKSGNVKLDKNNFPIYEKKECDIRGKRFSDLPEELQDRFDDYNFEIVQYLNCSSEDIAYHIARYNEGKPMTVSQKGTTRLGEEYAGMVKNIANKSFFKDMGNYKPAEYKNGTINRVVVEGIMAANYLEDWKKKQEEMCEYIKEHASIADFEHFESMVDRLEKVVTEEASEMFDSKDSFLWFGLFARFVKRTTNDKRFVEFMVDFTRSLHEKEVDGMSFDELKGKATKDRNVVLARMQHLERLMNEYLERKRVAFLK